MLPRDERHHLERVLRLRASEVITVTDGCGSWRTAQLGSLALADLGPVGFEPPRPTTLTVACAWTKSDKPELTVQKLTEVGIDRIVWFDASRSIGRRDPAKWSTLAERLGRVARAAVGQCRRVWVPDVVVGATFADLATSANACRADAGGRRVTGRDSCILIGPEGGWTDDERAAVSDHVSLGPHVLRAETAAIIAGAILLNAHSI